MLNSGLKWTISDSFIRICYYKIFLSKFLSILNEYLLESPQAQKQKFNYENFPRNFSDEIAPLE